MLMTALCSALTRLDLSYEATSDPELVSRLSVIKAVSAVFSLISSQWCLSARNMEHIVTGLSLLSPLLSTDSDSHLTSTLHWRDKPSLPSLYPGAPHSQCFSVLHCSREEGTSSAPLRSILLPVLSAVLLSRSQQLPPLICCL